MPSVAGRAPVHHLGKRAATRAELTQMYKTRAEAAIKRGVKPMKEAPADLAHARKFNITPKGLLGSSRTVYQIKGELFLETHPVVPHAKSTWFKLGRAPIF